MMAAVFDNNLFFSPSANYNYINAYRERNSLYDRHDADFRRRS